MSQQKPGWYRDPQGDASKLRYWDGSQWTNNLKATGKGWTLGIIALILSLVGPLLLLLFNLYPDKLAICFFLHFPAIIAGFILGIVSLVKSNKRSRFNAFGFAATIISSIALIFTVSLFLFLMLMGETPIDVMAENFSSLIK